MILRIKACKALAYIIPCLFVSPTIGSRREYDRALRGLYHSDGTNDFKWSYGDAHRQKRRQHRDPFAQFNDVFRNDPFFAEAFKSMDDLFDKHFSNNGGGGAQPNEGRDVGTNNNGGGIWNMVKNMMPNVNIEVKTSSSFNSGRSTTHSSTSRSYGGGNSRSRRQHSTSSYTSRSTRTVIQNGQRVTIQSLEKDGNKIEEKYIGEKLIERKINGMKEDLGRIGGGEEF